MASLTEVREVLLGPSESEVVLRLAEVPMGTLKSQGRPGAVYGREDSPFTGSLIAGGDDTNPDLVGRLKFEVYREMRATDPAVRSLEWLFRMPIRAADWKFAPAADDNPVDLVVAHACGWQFGVQVEGITERFALGGLDQTWKESVQQGLLMMPYGCMAEELIWAKETETWVDADGDEHLIRRLTRLAPRMPITIMEAEWDETTGHLNWLEQDLPDSQRIPGWKVAWYALDREANHWGTSLFRPAVGPWRLKQGLMTSAAIGWDRWAAGLPVVTYPKAGGAPAEQRADAIGKGARTHERGWIALSDEPGWNFRVENVAGAINDPVPLLRHYDSQIGMAGLQQFSSLGTTERGSRAVGEVLAGPFYEAAQAIADDFAAMRTRQVVRRFVDMNFGEKVAVPTLTVTGIEADDIAILASVLADLSSAGFNFTDPDTQNDVRRRLRFRELPEEIAEAVGQLPEDVGLQRTPPRPPRGPSQAPADEGGSIAA